MSADGMEDRVRDAFASAGPSEELVASVRSRAVAAAAARPPVRPRRGRRRVLATIAVAGAVLGAGVATASVVLDQRDPSVPASPGTRAAIGESGILASAPWLFQQEGAPLIQSVPRLPALRFPRGTTYRQALEGLVRSVIADGTLPAAARAVSPLPRGAIWARARGRLGPRLDLTAPAGYQRPAGRILVPVFTIPGWVSASQAAAIGKALADRTPIGEDQALLVTITPPALAACQRLPRARVCRLDPVPPEGAPAPS